MIRYAFLLACCACKTPSLSTSSLPILRAQVNSASDQSLIATRAFEELFEHGIARRDTVAIAASVTPELTFHERETVARIPRMDLIQMANDILTGFPDVRFTVPSVVANGDIAAARVEFVGTHLGTWEGIPATGRRVHVTEMFFCHLSAGRLSECWEEWDKWGLIQQLHSAGK